MGLFNNRIIKDMTRKELLESFESFSKDVIAFEKVLGSYEVHDHYLKSHHPYELLLRLYEPTLYHQGKFKPYISMHAIRKKLDENPTNHELKLMLQALTHDPIYKELREALPALVPGGIKKQVDNCTRQLNMNEKTKKTIMRQLKMEGNTDDVEWHLTEHGQEQFINRKQAYRRRNLNLLEAMARILEYDANKPEIAQDLRRHISGLKAMPYTSQGDIILYKKLLNHYREEIVEHMNIKKGRLFFAPLFFVEKKFGPYTYKNANNYIEKVADLVAKEEARKPQITISLENRKSKALMHVQCDLTDYYITAAQKSEIENVLKGGRPKWFESLSNIEKAEVQRLFKKAGSIIPVDGLYHAKPGSNSKEPLYKLSSQINTSSLIRKIPLSANNGQHHALIFDKEEDDTITLRTHQITARSGLEYPGKVKPTASEKKAIRKMETISSDLNDMPEGIRLMIQNIEQNAINALQQRLKHGTHPMLNQQIAINQHGTFKNPISIPYLYQTLLSPKHDKIDQEKYWLELITKYFKAARKIKVSINNTWYEIDIMHINHPINEFRLGNSKLAKLGPRLISRAIKNSASQPWYPLNKYALDSLVAYMRSRGLNIKYDGSNEQYKKDNMLILTQISIKLGAVFESNRENQLALKAKELIIHHRGLYENEVSDREEKDYNFELYKAAIDCILIDTVDGIAKTGCKSGKDRTGILLAYIDAINCYYDTYKTLPNIRNPNQRFRLNSIFCDYLLTKHQAVMAELNTPGCFGLKSLSGVLTHEVKELIKERAPHFLAENKELAGLNAPPNMIEETLHFPDDASEASSIILGYEDNSLDEGFYGKKPTGIRPDTKDTYSNNERNRNNPSLIDTALYKISSVRDDSGESVTALLHHTKDDIKQHHMDFQEDCNVQDMKILSAMAEAIEISLWQDYISAIRDNRLPLPQNIAIRELSETQGATFIDISVNKALDLKDIKDERILNIHQMFWQFRESQLVRLNGEEQTSRIIQHSKLKESEIEPYELKVNSIAFRESIKLIHNHVRTHQLQQVYDNEKATRNQQHSSHRPTLKP